MIEHVHAAVTLILATALGAQNVLLLWRREFLREFRTRENDLMIERNRAVEKLEQARQDARHREGIVAEQVGRIKCLEDEVALLNGRITELIGGPGGKE